MNRCLTLALSLTAFAGALSAQNMVANPGFEDGATGWTLPSPLYSVDAAVAHGGTRSLKYRNDPGGPYLIAGQGLPLKIGKAYRMSVWVKTEGIVSTDTGATLSMEWSGPQGYVGGSYAPGIMGASDWRRIVFYTCPVPEGVTGGSVIVYGRPGTSGTAWFDDVEVTELDRPPVRFSFADLPADRTTQTVWLGLASPEVRLRADLAPSPGLPAGSLLLSAVLWPGGGKTDGPVAPLAAEGGELLLPTENLPLGKTQLEVSLLNQADRRPLSSAYLWIEKKRLLSLATVYPNSAGVVGVGTQTDERVAVRATVAPQDASSERRYRARLSLLSAGKEVGRFADASLTDRKPVRLALSLAGLPFGLYDLRCDLFPRESRDPVARAQTVVTHADSSQRLPNATWIGANRMLMVDGQPFFPLGFYMLSSFETVFPIDQPFRWQRGQLCPKYYLPILDRLSRTNFNCVMDYGATMGGLDQARQFLDAAHARGVRSIFSVKDLMAGAFPDAYVEKLPWKDLREATRGVVRELRGHPAVIAWYVNDEVCRPDVWPGAMSVFRDTRETDPWHPTWAVHCDYAGVGTYREGCDIVGTDPYTLTGDINFTARSWHAAREQLPPEQPFWAVVQCMGWGYETSHPSDTREPTYDEERAATMAALAEGATGIIYYCFHSLQRSPRFNERFDELNRIAGEVRNLVPILSLPDAERSVRVESGTISALTKRARDGVYLLLASTLREDQDLVLRLPLKPKAIRDVKTGEQLRPDGDRLALRFKALDARTLELR